MKKNTKNDRKKHTKILRTVQQDQRLINDKYND